MKDVLSRRILVLLGAALLPLGANADVLADIRSEGKLVVGVKADYRPYGYRDPSGAIVGIEPDLAGDVAEDLGVELELVPVDSTNRMQFLEQGKIDLMIATMTDTEERRGVVQIVEPNYYSSGTNLLAWKKAGFETWEDLDGKPVCGIQGSFYNRKTQTEFGADISAFTGTAEALTALKQGNCLALVYDDSFILSKLNEDEWKTDFEMPLETIDDSSWGLAVALGEDAFAQFMSQEVEGWHTSGRILELETEYGLPNSPFAEKMHDEYGGK